jgi:hypothetical protein
MMQLTLTLAPGLNQRHKTLRECLHSSCMNSKGGVAGLAPGLDMSPSLLGRKLSNTNPDDPHKTLDIEDFDNLLTQLAVEKDLKPLYWLIEKYLPSDEQRRNATLDRLSSLLPEIVELVAEATAPARKRR